MINGILGTPVRIHFTSANASTAAALVLYDLDGTVRTLAADERLTIGCLNIATASAALIVSVFDDKDGDGAIDAGELLHRHISTDAVLLMSNVSYAGLDGMPGGKGRVPKVIASVAGQVDIAGLAYITKG